MTTLSFGFSSLVAVARTPQTMLSKSGECWHVVLILFLSSDLQLLWYRLRDVKAIADLLYGTNPEPPCFTRLAFHGSLLGFLSMTWFCLGFLLSLMFSSWDQSLTLSLHV